jgi:hypothetical protein
MSSASTAEGPSSVPGTPNLPAGSADTFSGRDFDTGRESSWVVLVATLAFPFSWWR